MPTERARAAIRAALSLAGLALLLASGCGDPYAVEVVEDYVVVRGKLQGVDFFDCSYFDSAYAPPRDEVAACLDAAWATCEPVWALLDGCGGRRWLVIVATPSGGCAVELFERDADDEHLVQRTCLTAELAPGSCDEIVVGECGPPSIHDIHPEGQEW